eukprot:674315_1
MERIWRESGAWGDNLRSVQKRVHRRMSIEPLDVRQLGIIHFKFESDPTVLEVHIFHAPKFSGEPGETEEMRPKWFPAPSVPFDQMWPDDRFWWPLFMKGVLFRGWARFKGPKMVGKAFWEVDSLVGADDLDRADYLGELMISTV